MSSGFTQQSDVLLYKISSFVAIKGDFFSFSIIRLSLLNILVTEGGEKKVLTMHQISSEPSNITEENEGSEVGEKVPGLKI